MTLSKIHPTVTPALPGLIPHSPLVLLGSPATKPLARSLVPGFSSQASFGRRALRDVPQHQWPTRLLSSSKPPPPFPLPLLFPSSPPPHLFFTLLLSSPHLSPPPPTPHGGSVGTLTPSPIAPDRSLPPPSPSVPRSTPSPSWSSVFYLLNSQSHPPSPGPRPPSCPGHSCQDTATGS